MLDFKNHRYEIAMSVTILRALVSSANRSSQNGPESKNCCGDYFYLLKKKKKLW